MLKVRNSSKGGFEPGLSRLRVRHSTAESPRSRRHRYDVESLLHGYAFNQLVATTLISSNGILHRFSKGQGVI